ncbi:type IV conjugative transfer system pilin TraA [Escherichia coli]|uniref:type IV conjugative transfer system pilin TraA n=1 Tax=Escherichia coli TaxID=562 RepID=UPI0028FCB692|nr:type IV conjugative transfer system pilin TraA [Escherichia coli]
MNAVLSVQGASAPVKKKSFFSKFTRLNMLRLARAVIPAAVLMMFFPQLAMAAGSSGQDLMASGNTTVKATFGKDSSVVNRPLTGCGDGGLLLSSHIIWQAFPGMRGISCLPLQWRHRC